MMSKKIDKPLNRKEFQESFKKEIANKISSSIASLRLVTLDREIKGLENRVKWLKRSYVSDCERIKQETAKAIRKDLERHHSKEANWFNHSKETNWFRWFEFTKEDWHKFWKKYGVGEEDDN